MKQELFNKIKEAIIKFIKQIGKDITDGTFKIVIEKGHLIFVRAAKHDILSFNIDLNLAKCL